MKLVVGCPVKDRAWILPDWFSALESQGVDYEALFILSPSEDDTEAILKEHEATILWDERPGRPLYEIDQHCWGSVDNYDYLSSMRNRMVEEAMARGADYFFSLDSDIILPPGGLKQLLRFAQGKEGVFSPRVNLATGQVANNVMQWDQNTPELANRDVAWPPSGQVDVVMAAMLLDRVGMQCRWSSHPQGEDIGFSLDAYTKHIKLWWLGELRCDHWMHRY